MRNKRARRIADTENSAVARRLPWWVPVSFLLLALAIYGRALQGQFLWDDEEQILNNSAIHSLGEPWRFFQSSSFSSGGGVNAVGIYYKPLMTLSYAVLWKFFGSEPFAFHLFQLLLHVGSSLLLARILLRFFPWVLSTALAAVFLVHPLNVECVIYAADLQDALMLCFGLGALALVSDDLTGRVGLFRQAAISVLLLASMLSKETGVLFLPLVLTLGRASRRRDRHSSAGWASPGLAVFVAAAGYALLRFGVAELAVAHGDLQPIARADLPTRLLTLPRILLFYLEGFFVPLRLVTAQHWLVESADWANFWRPLILVAISMLAALAHARHSWREGNTAPAFFLAWAALGLGLHAQIFPLDLTVADRWFYFSMAGALGFLGTLVLRIRAEPARLGALVGLGVFAAGLAVRSEVRSRDWKDGFTLFSTDVVVNPEAFDLRNNAGVEFWRAGDRGTAKSHFEASVRLAPHWWTNWSNLGAAYEAEGKPELAEEAYRKSIQNGVYHLAYENLAMLLARRGREVESIEFLEKTALRVLPNNKILRDLHAKLTRPAIRQDDGP